MEPIVFMAVLLAAALHAMWNAAVKSKGDKTSAITAVTLGQGAIALIMVPLVPLPGIGTLPFLAMGIVFHVGYRLMLSTSYRLGDLTQVYPMARGTGPLIVAALSGVLIGERLNWINTLGVCLIASGILSLAVVRGGAGLRNPRAALAAVTTGCFIAGYSIADGLGVRQFNGPPYGYLTWLMLSDTVAFMVVVALMRGGSIFNGSGRAYLGTALFGGGASILAYGLVMWAFTLAPIALVTALRETSIIFALLIGVVLLKEPVNLVKVFATMVTLTGAALARLAR